jgi:hypothetical protein
MSYHIDSDHADTIRERFGDPQQQGFSERFMRPQPCAAPLYQRGKVCERNENKTTKGNDE